MEQKELKWINLERSFHSEEESQNFSTQSYIKSLSIRV